MMEGVPTSQGMPKVAGKRQKLGARHGPGPPTEPPEGTHSANTLVLDFQPPGL